MRTGILTTAAIVLLVSFSVILGSCQNGVAPNGENGDPQPGSGGLKAPVRGATYLDGDLVLESISVSESPGQPVSVVLKNVSGRDLEGLTIQMIFLSPSTDGMSEHDTEKVIDEVSKLYMNESHPLSIRRSNQGKLQEVRLNVTSAETRFVPTMGREGNVPGSKLLGGLLEVIAVDDRLTFEPPAISFTVKNISGDVVDGIGYQVMFRKRGGAMVPTQWMEVLESIAPGQTIELRASLAGQDVGAAESVLNVRWEDI